MSDPVPEPVQDLLESVTRVRSFNPMLSDGMGDGARWRPAFDDLAARIRSVEAIGRHDAAVFGRAVICHANQTDFEVRRRWGLILTLMERLVREGASR